MEGWWGRPQAGRVPKAASTAQDERSRWRGHLPQPSVSSLSGMPAAGPPCPYPRALSSPTFPSSLTSWLWLPGTISVSCPPILAALIPGPPPLAPLQPRPPSLLLPEMHRLPLHPWSLPPSPSMSFPLYLPFPSCPSSCSLPCPAWPVGLLLWLWPGVASGHSPGGLCPRRCRSVR